MRPPASVSAAAGRRSPRRLPPPSPLAVPASVSTAAGRESCGSAAAGASRARWGRAAQHPEQPPATWIEAEEAPARESSDESSSSSFSGSRSGRRSPPSSAPASYISRAPSIERLLDEDAALLHA
ncbi:Os08g0185566 [Oryza sativa Japonica Group]|nr:Os08g0185566 [Oryza sativa Japonica Group]